MGRRKAIGSPRLEELKKFLIESSESHDLSEYLPEIKEYLNADLVQERIVATDVVSIWLLRAVQRNQEFHEGSIHELFLHVTSFIDSTDSGQTNACLGLLRRLVQFLTQSGREDLIQKWTHVLWKDRTQKKEWFLVFEALAKESPVATDVILDPTFVEWHLHAFNSTGISNSASKALVAVLVHVPGNYQMWKNPVTSSLENPNLWQNITTYLLPLLFRLDTLVAKHFINHISASSGHVQLAVLRASQSVLTTSDPVNSGLISESRLYEFATSSNDTYRIDALALAVSTMKSSTVPASYVLLFFSDETVLNSCINEASTPELRGAFASLYRKFLLATRESLLSLRRRAAKGKVVKSENPLTHAIMQARNNMLALITVDSSYSQLLVGFEILQLFADEEFDGARRGKRSEKLPPVPKLFDLFDNAVVVTLIKFTTSNYEDIRARSKTLLSRVHLPNWDMYPYQSMLHNSIHDLASLKGRTADAAVDLLDVVGSTQSQQKLINSLLAYMEDLNSHSLHGFFAVFTTMFNNPSCRSGNITGLGNLAAVLISKCFDQWRKYKAQTTFETLEDNDDISGTSWRSIREGGFLIKAMMEANKAEDWQLFPESQFTALCDLIIEQLSTVTHRGVFTAVYDSYVTACNICLSHVTSSLRGLPEKWLETNLDLILSKTQFVSRRSAGLPILIIGILNAYYNHGDFGVYAGSQDNAWDKLLHTMHHLHELAQKPYSLATSQKTDVPQVHAFNCIKQIYMDLVLWPCARGYLEISLQLAVENLGHNEWSIKNGALMLFTALQNRIFGTNKLGDSMTGVKASVLFSRYRQLQPLVYAGLEKCIKGENSIDVAIPILNLLSRVERLFMQDKTSSPFYHILSSCLLVHRQWKVRELAAAVLARQLALPEEALNECIRSLTCIEQNWSRANIVHGHVLLLSDIHKRFGLDDDIKLWCTDVFLELFSREQWLALVVLLDVVLCCMQVLDSLFAFLVDLGQTGKVPLNGQKCLFSLKAAKYLMSHDQEKFLRLAGILLRSRNIDLQLVALNYLRAHVTYEDGLIDELNELACNKETFISCRVETVRLLAGWGVTLPKELPDLEWSRDLQLCMAAPTICDMEDPISCLRQLLAWSELEEARLVGLEAAAELLKHRQELSTDVMILLLCSLHDFDKNVRARCNEIVSQQIGEYGRSCSYNFQKGLQKVAIGEIPWSDVIRDILFLADKELTLCMQQTSNAIFDIERDNLHINEVRVFSQFVKVLISQDKEKVKLVEAKVQEQLDIIDKIIEERPEVVLSWHIETHFDTAIRKVFILGESFGVKQERLHLLQQKLTEMMYVGTCST